MPKTKLTRARLQNHLQYSKWMYILLLLVGALAADLFYTTTAYRPPNSRKVDIQIVTTYADTSNAGAYAQTALAAGQAYERARDAAAGVDTSAEDYEVPLMEVNFYNIAYSGGEDTESDYYGAQKFMVMLGAQEGHVYLVNRAMLETLVDSGVAYPLDGFLADGTLNIGDVDLSTVTYDEYVDEGQPATGNTCVYALPIGSLTGLTDAFDFRPDGMYMVMMAYVDNPDTVAVVMQSLIDQFQEIEQVEAE